VRPISTISERLKTAQRNTSNKGGCVTCQWWQEISEETRELINEWIDAKHSMKQLYSILSEPAEGGEPPLPVSNTGFRLHMDHHDLRCREQ
jgi:hypothetical protein